MGTDYRQDFPLLLSRQENGKPLAYLDNAATTQKPRAVLSAMQQYYGQHAANPHRGAYALSAEATALYEDARAAVARFIGAPRADSIVFTKNATEALNLVAHGYGAGRVGPGDEILVAITEHHSNLLPWQAVAAQTGATLRYLYTDETGRIPSAEIADKLHKNTKIVAVGHTGNVLGIANPVEEIIQKAHRAGAVVVLDAAQAVAHVPVNAAALDVDFLAFSAHKMYGPEGLGVLYAKPELLEQTQPLLLGGGIVEEVSEQGARLLPPPLKFEAGTPNVAAAVGLAAAIGYIQGIGHEALWLREARLTTHLLDKLAQMPDVELYGLPAAREGMATGGIATAGGHITGAALPHATVAFNVRGVHPHDVASILDASGVAIRAGHHCAQSLLRHLGLNACCRASLAIYNTTEEIDRLAEALGSVRGWLGL